MNKTNLHDGASRLMHRREVLAAGVAAGATVLVARPERAARGAHAAYDYPCNWRAGFDPPVTPAGRVGYLTDFAGIGLPTPLVKDLTVPCAWNSAAAPAYGPVAPSHGRVDVVGVLDKFEWSGAPTDPMSFAAYVSTENSTLLTSVQSPRPSSAALTALGFWIAQYDPGTKTWFEQAYPSSPPRFSGQLPGFASSVSIAAEPVKVPSVDDVGVWKITFVVAPSTNLVATLRFASSPSGFTTANFGAALPPPANGR